MEYKEYKENCNKAVAFKNTNEYDKAIETLESVRNTEYSKQDDKYFGLLGWLYRNVNEHEKSIDCFKHATNISPDSELASLGLYLSFIAADRSENAIAELKRYMDKYPADLYKDTLLELIEDFEDGYALNYKDIIMPIAQKNNIKR